MSVIVYLNQLKDNSTDDVGFVYEGDVIKGLEGDVDLQT